MNLKVRLRNPVFWLTAIPAVAACVYTLLGLFGVVPAIAEDVLVNALTAVISALATLGILIDPTTEGISDSNQAMTYTAPKTDKGAVDNDVNE